jgi:hypothetical protein
MSTEHEPDNPSDYDDQRHVAHSRSRSSVIGGTSRLPIAPSDIGFQVGDDGSNSVIRHRRASRMISDMVAGGSFQRHIMTSGGRIARAVMTVQPDSDPTWSALPAAYTAKTQSAVTVALMELSRILEVYWQAL